MLAVVSDSLVLGSIGVLASSDCTSLHEHPLFSSAVILFGGGQRLWDVVEGTACICRKMLTVPKPSASCWFKLVTVLIMFQCTNTQFDLVCSDQWKKPFTSTVLFLGILFGAFFSGQVADR